MEFDSPKSYYYRMSKAFSTFIIFAAISLLVISSCEKEAKSPIPDVPVSFQGYLSQPDFAPLTSINNTVKVANYGYRRHGVLVYRYTEDTFYAFDATCPRDLNDGSVVISNDNPWEAVCPICKTVYSLMNYGSTSNGLPLKRYQTSFNGTVVSVYN